MLTRARTRTSFLSSLALVLVFIKNTKQRILINSVESGGELTRFNFTPSLSLSLSLHRDYSLKEGRELEVKSGEAGECYTMWKGIERVNDFENQYFPKSSSFYSCALPPLLKPPTSAWYFQMLLTEMADCMATWWLWNERHNVHRCTRISPRHSTSTFCLIGLQGAIPIPLPAHSLCCLFIASASHHSFSGMEFTVQEQPEDDGRKWSLK